MALLATSSLLIEKRHSLYFLQLRVIRAFRSTLEDLEERRSVHSLHSLHSMRSSRSHTGPRPLSDFTFIDEDSTNPMINALKYGRHQQQQHTSEQDYDNKGTNISSTNSPASPLLLNVPGTGGASYNNHRYTNNNRTSSNNALDHIPLNTNNASSRNSNTAIPSSPSLESSDRLLTPDLPKLVHETSI